MVLGPYGGLVWSRTLKMWKTIGFTVFSLDNLKNNWFYCAFAQQYWKSTGFKMLLFKQVETPLVLLCFRAKMLNIVLVLLCFRSKVLNTHWFYCVFAQKYWKSIGFTVFSLNSIEKALVLLCVRSKRLKNHWFYCKIIVKIQKNGKKKTKHWFYSEKY